MWAATSRCRSTCARRRCTTGRAGSAETSSAASLVPDVKREKPHQERNVTREKPARGPDMARHEIAVERLVGRKLLALNGRAIGRIEEICVEPRGRGLVVTEFHVGAYA